MEDQVVAVAEQDDGARGVRRLGRRRRRSAGSSGPGAADLSKAQPLARRRRVEAERQVARDRGVAPLAVVPRAGKVARPRPGADRGGDRPPGDHAADARPVGVVAAVDRALGVAARREQRLGQVEHVYARLAQAGVEGLVVRIEPRRRRRHVHRRRQLVGVDDGLGGHRHDEQVDAGRVEARREVENARQRIGRGRPARAAHLGGPRPPECSERHVAQLGGEEQPVAAAAHRGDAGLLGAGGQRPRDLPEGCRRVGRGRRSAGRAGGEGGRGERSGGDAGHGARPADATS